VTGPSKISIIEGPRVTHSPKLILIIIFYFFNVFGRESERPRTRAPIEEYIRPRQEDEVHRHPQQPRRALPGFHAKRLATINAPGIESSLHSRLARGRRKGQDSPCSVFCLPPQGRTEEDHRHEEALQVYPLAGGRSRQRSIKVLLEGRDESRRTLRVW